MLFMQRCMMCRIGTAMSDSWWLEPMRFVRELRMVQVEVPRYCHVLRIALRGSREGGIKNDYG